MNSVVLDASALLAFAQDEPGSEVVKPRLGGAFISAVNYSEFLKKSVEHGVPLGVAVGLVKRNRLRVIGFDAALGELAAGLWLIGKPLGLSFADRACLALGIATAAAVYTADRQMAKADVPVAVVLVREGH